jgi:hypothetical protein
MTKSIVSLLVIVFGAVSFSVNAQTKETTSNDVRLVKDQPNVFVSFEREGKWKPFKKFESERRVWLRFHNNSKWQIGACMWDVPKEYGDKDIVYDVERYKKGGHGVTPVTTSQENSCPRIFIESGRSILFSVPIEHLADGLAIKIQFRYEWETEPDGFSSDLEPKHYAYFYSSDIPKR